MRYAPKFLLVVPLLLAAFAFAPPARALDLTQPAVKAFIATMIHKHGFDRAQLRRLLAATPLDPTVIQRMNAPAEALPWYRYRAIFVTPARIAGGRAFMTENRKTLAAAERRYGVPAAIVTALIGMESRYGSREGGFSALSALATLAFDYPSRAEFFRRELAQYLILCRKNGFDPSGLQSSYAGALGAGQFMPSSYLAYAVDADGGGSDLFGDWQDIIASVAHFLGAHGWRRSSPVVAHAQVKAGTDASRFTGKTLPARDLASAGIVFDAPVAATASVRLVKVEAQTGDEDDPQYWVGLPNFSVIMRYNHSPLYALAAAQLASAIASPSSNSASPG